MVAELYFVHEFIKGEGDDGIAEFDLMPILIGSTEGFMLMGEYVLENEVFKILSLTVFLFIGKVDVEAVVEKSFAVKVVIEEDGGDFVEGFD